MVFGCDLRTLALFRVCLGFLIIADLVMRGRTLAAHYTDHGVLPRSALLELFPGWKTSLHLISGSMWVESLLFVVAGVVAIALILGYQARVAAFLSWVLLISLGARNNFVSQGGDLLLRVLVLWAIFLPIGARFSIDAALNTARTARNDYFSMATAALLVQVVSVYFFTALLKSDPVWIPEGTAVYYALTNDTLTTPFALWLRQFEWLLPILTYYVWILEIITPVLLFLPWFNFRVRLFALLLLITMHIAFFLNLRIGLFPFISITSLLTFTPGIVWDWLERRIRSPERTGIKLYYDGECTFCHKVCLILRSFLLPPSVPITPAQDDAGMHALMREHNSWIVVDHTGTAHLRWQGVAYVVRRSVIFAPIGMLFGATWLKSIGDRIYDVVARNRMALGRVTASVLPFRGLNSDMSWGANAAIAILLAGVIWTNFATLEWFPYKLPRSVSDVTRTLRLNQRWNMFAPTPSKGTSWFVARGVLGDGTGVDIYLDRPAETLGTRDEYLRANNTSYRWRKFLTQLAHANRIELRPYYTDYLCRQWLQRHGEKLKTVELHLFMQWNHIEQNKGTDHHLLWVGDCATKPIMQVAELRAGRIRTNASLNL